MSCSRSIDEYLKTARDPLHCELFSSIVGSQFKMNSSLVRLKRKNPTKDDWTRLRPRAEELYKVQKRKIDDIVNILQRENNLHIT